MEKHTTKTSLFGMALALAAVLIAFSPARAQYESFFGGESWGYATAFHPIMKARDYNPELIGCLTNTYVFSRTDTVTVAGQKYYNSTFNGLGYHPVKLREDTVNGRLYSLIDSNEYLICDMSLEVGDTFSLPIPTWNYMETMRMVADSVSFINSKKVIHLSALSGDDAYWWWTFLGYNGAFNISLRFMEGVGPTYGIVPPYQDGELLLCLTKDDSLYYMTHPDLGCWQDYVSVSDYPEQSITIFPNPAKDQISVLFETDEDVVGSIVIRDMAGRVCMQASVTKPVENLNIGHLCRGTYLITFKDQNNRKITKKIVKK